MQARLTKQTKNIGIAVLIPVIACAGLWFWIDSSISLQQKRLVLLDHELNQLHTEHDYIQRLPQLMTKYLSRLTVYQNLRSTRQYGIIQILGRVSCVTPDKLLLTRLDLSKNRLLLAGIADSENTIQQFENSLLQLDILSPAPRGNSHIAADGKSFQFEIMLKPTLSLAE